MRKTVISQTGGRLGNVLFSISAGAYYAKSIGADYLVESNTTFGNDFAKYRNTLYSNCHIIDSLSGYDIKEKIDETAVVQYTPIQSSIDTVYVTGCRQSPFYWNNDKQFVLDLFRTSVKDEIVSDIKTAYPIDWNNTLALNVRRGDYLVVQSVIGMVDNQWYFNALEHFPDSYNVIVVSDDIEYCKTVFKSDRFIFADKTISNKYPKSLYDLYLQGLTNGNIISNSTFSWWAAYFNETPGRKVICPYEWGHFAGDCADYIPNNDNWETEKSIWKVY